MKYDLICIDLDGVIADMTSAAAQVHGIKLPYGKLDYGYLYSKFTRKSDFWKKCHHHDFWANIPLYPWSKDLVSIVEKSKIPFVFLTKAPMGTGAWSGKAEWIQKNFGKHQNKLWVVRGDKALMSRQGYLLIDDKPENIKSWTEAGGDGIIWPEVNPDPNDDYKSLIDPLLTSLRHLS